MSEEDGAGTAVASYKRLLQTICDNRPSGTRGRLASALGTNRSFVSQLASPTYAMPIPAQHLPAIFDVCRFSPSERAEFLAVYDRAHPGRRDGGADAAPSRTITLRLPDLGDTKRNQALADLLTAYARQLGQLLTILNG